MVIPWLIIGYEILRLTVTLGLGFLAFRFIIIPTINEQLEETQDVLNEAAEKMSKIGRFAGMKSSDYTAANEVESIIGRELMEKQIPELGILQLVLSPSSWEKVEDMLENNPQQALALYKKFGPQLKALSGNKAENPSSTDF